MISAVSTNKKLRVLIAMGTRPEIIKQAPLVWASRERPEVETIVVHSGQHSDLAEPMLSYFEIKPDIHLDLMRSHANLTSLVGGCIQRMERVLVETAADVVVVQGDTATSTAIALAGFYSRVPVVHVEAGLRTGDLSSPWPEEFNRRVVTLGTDLHCAPTQYAVDKLLAEQVPATKILLSGNPVVDALRWTLHRERAHQDGVANLGSASIAASSGVISSDADQGSAALPNLSQPLVVLTAHRRENFGKPLEAICAAVLELAEAFSDHRFVFVTHPNPQAGPVVRSILEGRSRIELAPPMSYPEFVRLMSSSRLMISDSGGIQEEAPSLGVPLLVTRLSTERPEAVFSGAAELVGTDRELIVRRATELLRQASSGVPQPARENPFGDGTSGKKIIQEIVSRYGARE
jgi:UDP-N-acetylglucosamine 2-epimerase (non-hydrolysing)